MLLGPRPFAGESAVGLAAGRVPDADRDQRQHHYVISYHAPNGHYPGPDGYFATAGVDKAPLHALRERRRWPERPVRLQPGDRVPDQTSACPRDYFVDVVFDTTDGPRCYAAAVIVDVPVAGAIRRAHRRHRVTATFNEPIDRSTMSVHGRSARRVGTCGAGDGVLRRATLHGYAARRPPSLAVLDVHTRRRHRPRVKDSPATRMAADFTWSFTTAAPPPPPPTRVLADRSWSSLEPANPFSRYYARDPARRRA